MKVIAANLNGKARNIARNFTKTNRHSWQRDLAAFIETLMQYIYAAETEHNKAV